jgi:IS1 family transposase
MDKMWSFYHDKGHHIWLWRAIDHDTGEAAAFWFGRREHKNVDKLMDIIGHITWNYQDYSIEKILLEYYKKHKDNEFIEWKIIRTLQSFNSENVKKILANIIRTHKNKIIIEEAKRSIKRIENKISCESQIPQI